MQLEATLILSIEKLIPNGSFNIFFHVFLYFIIKMFRILILITYLDDNHVI